MSRRELIIGCGSKLERRIQVDGRKRWTNLTTLDLEAAHKPHVVHDLNVVPWPFEDNSFDEIHAYEILEHLGSQGDYRSFFDHFYEAWRLLRPEGKLAGSTPLWNSPWAFGDPGHTRIISGDTLVFLSQQQYADQVGRTSMSDYRSVWHGDFEPVWMAEAADSLYWVLKAIKPAR